MFFWIGYTIKVITTYFEIVLTVSKKSRVTKITIKSIP